MHIRISDMVGSICILPSSCSQDPEFAVDILKWIFKLLGTYKTCEIVTLIKH